MKGLPEVLEFLYLVARSLFVVQLHRDHGAVGTLGDVLVEILCILRRVGFLHVDVAVEEQAEHWAVGYNVSVGDLEGEAAPGEGDNSSAVLRRSPPVGGKAAHCIDRGILLVRLGKLLCTLGLLHAGRLGVELTARSMDHVGQHNLFQSPHLLLVCIVVCSLWIRRQLGGYHVVHLFGSCEPIHLVHNQQDVGVWEASLLEFNCGTVRKNSKKLKEINGTYGKKEFNSDGKFHLTGNEIFPHKEIWS